MPRTDAPAPGELEPAAARATVLLAEWLAVPQRDLAVVVVQAVAWPDACLGVDQPGMACASVITPGFRVLLRDRLGGLHSVHTDDGAGAARWAGELRVEGEVAAVDRGTQRVTLRVPGGEMVMRLVPGTQWIPQAATAGVAGARVLVAYDPSGSSAVPPAVAWVAVAEG